MCAARQAGIPNGVNSYIDAALATESVRACLDPFAAKAFLDQASAARRFAGIVDGGARCGPAGAKPRRGVEGGLHFLLLIHQCLCFSWPPWRGVEGVKINRNKNKNKAWQVADGSN